MKYIWPEYWLYITVYTDCILNHEYLYCSIKVMDWDSISL